VLRGFADDLDLADDSVVCSGVAKKALLVEPLEIALYLGDRVEDVPELDGVSRPHIGPRDRPVCARECRD